MVGSFYVREIKSMNHLQVNISAFRAICDLMRQSRELQEKLDEQKKLLSAIIAHRNDASDAWKKEDLLAWLDFYISTEPNTPNIESETNNWEQQNPGWRIYPNHVRRIKPSIKSTP
jgi:hypothetical protein